MKHIILIHNITQNPNPKLLCFPKAKYKINILIGRKINVT